MSYPHAIKMFTFSLFSFLCVYIFQSRVTYRCLLTCLIVISLRSESDYNKEATYLLTYVFWFPLINGLCRVEDADKRTVVVDFNMKACGRGRGPSRGSTGGIVVRYTGRNFYNLQAARLSRQAGGVDGD